MPISSLDLNAVGGLVGGEVHVAETRDAVVKIVGCAVWYGPGGEINDTYVSDDISLPPMS
jgi:hypothetical protein